jgi:hypothetical protein
MAIGIDLDKLFWLVAERQAIRDRRIAGQEWPWSKDPVLNHLHFPNTRRELDPTTKWIREQVVSPLRGRRHMARAVTLCRLVNRLSLLTHLRPVLLEPYHFDKWARYVARVLRMCGKANRLFSPTASTRVSEHAAPIDGLLAACWIFDNEPDVLNTSYVETAHAAVQKRMATGIHRARCCPLGYEMALDVVGETAIDRMTWANVSVPIAEVLGFSPHNGITMQRRFIPALHSLMVEADRREMSFVKAEDAERALALYHDYTMYAAKWARGDRRLTPARWFRPLITRATELSVSETNHMEAQ